ncbi:MAG: nucleotide excision repair endonuclease, partial [Hamadaea sp.]|nr:nucleotide excision repair endonuclease [Hamadaea sp.]
MTAAARAAVARLPAQPGVYRFRDPQGRALYVGRAVDLRRRVRSYWSDLGDRQHLRRMMPRVARVEAVVCASDHEAAWLERNILERRLPPWNRAIGGQENPVHLRLDTSASDPGLRVVHEVTQRPGSFHFGPYLGGTRVRLAAAGL